jgi:hypothetical protein
MLNARPRREGRGAGCRARSGKLGAGAGKDDDPVLAVVADIIERIGQLTMRPKPPAQAVAVGVQRHLQDAVAPLEAGALILILIIRERRGHGFLPLPRRFLSADRKQPAPRRRRHQVSS